MIYDFSKKNSPKLNEVGGKAKALIETSGDGYPVPEGIALSVEFFKPWLDEIKSSEEWKAVLANTTKASCDVVKLIPSLLNVNNWTEKEEKIIDRHFAKLQELLVEGKLILAGKTLGIDEKTFGIVILEVESQN